MGDRIARLESNQRILYHQTSPDVAASILATQRMHSGVSGLASAAIYFATTPCATKYKAHAFGVILQATVSLGRVKELPFEGAAISLTDLTREGYDSVLIRRSSGDEYAVYHTNQVKDIRRFN